MRITYSISREDLVALDAYQSKSGRDQFRKKLLLVFLTLLALAMAAARFPGPYQTQAISVVTTFVTPLLTILIVIWWLLGRAKVDYERLEKEVPGLYGPRSLELAQDQFLTTDDTGEGTTRWSAVTGVAPGAEQIFITLAGGAAYVIPRRAFAGPEEADRFAEIATAYWSAANSARPR